MNRLEVEMVTNLVDPPGSQFQRGYLARVMQDYARKRRRKGCWKRPGDDWLYENCREVLKKTRKAPATEKAVAEKVFQALSREPIED